MVCIGMYLPLSMLKSYPIFISDLNYKTISLFCGVSLLTALISIYNQLSKVDKSYTTIGLGIPMGNAIMLDAAYIFSQWEKISRDWYTPAGATEEVQSGRFLVNFSYLF